MGIHRCGRSNIQIGHFVGHGYLEVEKSMIHSFTITFGAIYLTGMVTRFPPYETFSLIKNSMLHQSKNYKNPIENSNFWCMWPLGHICHVIYSLINMLCISTGKFDDKLRLQILSVSTTANTALRMMTQINVHSLNLVKVVMMPLNDALFFIGNNCLQDIFDW